MRKRHDPFLKLLYKAGARDAVRLFFPDLASHIDWERVQWVDKEVPVLSSEDGTRAMVADLVGVTRDVEGRYLEVLLHPELQMRAPADMGWRVLQYNAGLMLQQASPDARVLTIVFYHCRGVGGIREERYSVDFHGHSVLEVGYWSVGLGDLDADQYVESDNPMAWALASWMRHHRKGRPELRLRLQERILRLVSDAWYRRLLWDTVRTYFRLNPAEQEEEQRLIRSGQFGEVREMAETWLGRFEEDAERRAHQTAIIHVLQARFDVVPDDIEGRIREVRAFGTLERLTRRAATAPSLDEFRKALPH